MKAEAADTVYRELLRRSSADGLAYLREQLAAHEAKGSEQSRPRTLRNAARHGMAALRSLYAKGGDPEHEKAADTLCAFANAERWP